MKSLITTYAVGLKIFYEYVQVNWNLIRTKLINYFKVS